MKWIGRSFSLNGTRLTRSKNILYRPKANVLFSDVAKADLREIWDYIADDSPLQADRLIMRFRSKLEHLAKWNTLGRPRPELGQDCRS